jgi:hypothetical protein
MVGHLLGAAGAADERGRVRLQVAHEHVVGRIAVVGAQVRRLRAEDGEASVPGDPGHL